MNECNCWFSLGLVEDASVVCTAEFELLWQVTGPSLLRSAFSDNPLHDENAMRNFLSTVTQLWSHVGVYAEKLNCTKAAKNHASPQPRCNMKITSKSDAFNHRSPKTRKAILLLTYRQSRRCCTKTRHHVARDEVYYVSVSSLPIFVLYKEAIICKQCVRFHLVAIKRPKHVRSCKISYSL